MSEGMKADILRRAAETGFFRNCCGRHDVEFSLLKAIAELASDLLNTPVHFAEFQKGNEWRAGGQFAFLLDAINAERRAYNTTVLHKDGMDAGRGRLARERNSGRWGRRGSNEGAL